MPNQSDKKIKDSTYIQMNEFRKALKKWKEQGRTEEQIYGATNFITSGPFFKALNKLDTRQSVIEEVESMRKNYSPYVRNHGLPEHKPLTLTNANREGYNTALDDILEKLKNG